MGGIAGTAIAWWGVRLLEALDPAKALRVENQLALVAGDQGREPVIRFLDYRVHPPPKQVVADSLTSFDA